MEKPLPPPPQAADPGVGKGRGTNRLSVARWLEK